jgi:hypothetical protein
MFFWEIVKKMKNCPWAINPPPCGVLQTWENLWEGKLPKVPGNWYKAHGQVNGWNGLGMLLWNFSAPMGWEFSSERTTLFIDRLLKFTFC